MAEKFEISAASFKSKMQIPQEMQSSYDKAVKVGLAMLFAPETVEQTIDYIGDGTDAPKKIAEGVAGVMGMIVQQSNGTLPGQIIVPVGVELIGHVVEAARKGGIQISDADVAEGVAQFIQAVLQQAGATPEQMQQMMGGMDSGQATPQLPKE